MATITDEQIAERLRELGTDVRETQREIVPRLDRIERGLEDESKDQERRFSSLKLDMAMVAYFAVLILILAIVVATSIVIKQV